jgi:hypothetical protein
LQAPPSNGTFCSFVRIPDFDVADAMASFDLEPWPEGDPDTDDEFKDEDECTGEGDVVTDKGAESLDSGRTGM